jgi:hypothetical protein
VGLAIAAVLGVRAAAARAGAAAPGPLAAAVRVVAAVLAVASLPLAFPLATARSGAAAVTTPTQDEEAGVHPRNRWKIRYRCGACHARSLPEFLRWGGSSSGSSSCALNVGFTCSRRAASGRQRRPRRKQAVWCKPLLGSSFCGDACQHDATSRCRSE